MTTTSIDLPETLYRYIESQVEKGEYTSKAEAIRYMIRKEMENKNKVDEELSEEAIKKIKKAREREEVEGDIRELIEGKL